MIYIFIAGWMFLLGIMVGRGTSPVKFDTQKFQNRLETIAKEFGEKKDTQKKMDLKFYNVLDRPVPEESVTPKKKPLEIIPKKEKETIIVLDTILLKTSKKKQTFKQATGKTKTDMGADHTLEAKEGIYTIQIAAFKDFKDAVSQMTSLEKKGFPSYRVKVQKEGVTWYRIRTGSFTSYDEAKKFKEKLNKAKINSMIIKRGNDDISQ